ncbi:glyoxalase [Robbsia andropogonis]|uniref:Glyoxalase n=1 Tax=Robbsia andropogonis TaxID=28092 RepID=A0A0F5JV18_9BURK|nr:VOC family protein [Robbsia andropogonis]KKB61147.1 glyoxalase [Robbsia andropogonis]MCP1121240.1 VOC family protein [Robbsia andropogonis]MCP1131007.1 VOC family protein [Robbsia andropogonis]
MKSLQQATPAFLHHLRIVSANPVELVKFYERMLDLTVVPCAKSDDVVMTGPSRAIIVSAQREGNSPYYAYSVSDTLALSRLADRLTESAVSFEPIDDPFFPGRAMVFSDPQGRRFVFGVASRTEGPGAPARLQHTVFQTTELECVTRFFVDKIGFTISDEVVDADGSMAVVFLRSDDEHHTLAFFRGSKNEWDHHCYETNEWNDIRDWGDRFATAEVPIFFGPGRHGPGNNLFFMVTDPDGNCLEFSAELQRVAAEAEPGLWPQSERTLNSWGRAWIRM